LADSPNAEIAEFRSGFMRITPSVPADLAHESTPYESGKPRLKVVTQRGAEKRWAPGALDAVHDCAYTHVVEFEWDPVKARANWRKHRVDFADVTGVFDDPLALTRAFAYPGELRYVTVGVDTLGRTVVVAYAWRGERLRIISARRAAPRERRAYEG